MCVREMQRWRDAGERTERKPQVQFKDSKERRLSFWVRLSAVKQEETRRTEGKGEERRGEARGERRAQPVVTRTK